MPLRERENQVKEGLAKAIITYSASLAEEERKLTMELARGVNEFGRTIADEVPWGDLLLPTRRWYLSKADKASALGELAYQLSPSITRPWNTVIRSIYRVLGGELTVRDLRSPDTHLEELRRPSHRLGDPTIAIVRAVFAPV